MLRENLSVPDSTQQFIDALAGQPQEVAHCGDRLCRALGVNDSWSDGTRLHQAEAIYKASKQQLGKDRAKGLRPPIFAAFGVSAAAVAKFEAKKDRARTMRAEQQAATELQALRDRALHAAVCHERLVTRATGEVAIQVRGGAVFYIPREAIEAAPHSYLESWLSGRFGPPVRQGDVYQLNHLPGGDANNFHVVADYYQGILPDISSAGQGRTLLRLADALCLEPLAEHISRQVQRLQRHTPEELKLLQAKFDHMIGQIPKSPNSGAIVRWLMAHLPALADAAGHPALSKAVTNFLQADVTARSATVSPLREAIKAAYPNRPDDSRAAQCLVDLEFLVGTGDAASIAKVCAHAFVIDAHEEGHLTQLAKVIAALPYEIYCRYGADQVYYDDKVKHERLPELRLQLRTLIYLLQ